MDTADHSDPNERVPHFLISHGHTPGEAIDNAHHMAHGQPILGLRTSPCPTGGWFARGEICEP